MDTNNLSIVSTYLIESYQKYGSLYSVNGNTLMTVDNRNPIIINNGSVSIESETIDHFVVEKNGVSTIVYFSDINENNYNNYI